MRPNRTDDVRAVWCDVLKIDHVEDTDDFFKIGGHSLTAMQVTARLRDRLGGVRVPTRVLFAHRTFRAFADAVNEAAAS
jgi:hypothetical protein